MKLMLCLVFCLVIGCSSVGQIKRDEPDKKFDLAETHFKIMVAKPVEAAFYLIFLIPPEWGYAGAMERAAEKHQPILRKGEKTSEKQEGAVKF